MNQAVDIARKLHEERKVQKLALLVEDSDDDAILAEIVILKAGIRVERVRTTEEALMRISEEAFDMVVLDVKLPGSKLDGIDCALAIKQLKPELPCLISTGSKFMVDKTMAGMVIIPKPLNFDNLKAVCLGLL